MKKHILIAAAVATMGLTACGSSTAPTATAPAAGVVSLSGVVSKGPVKAGAVTIFDANNAVIGTTTTDPYGAYSVSVPDTAIAPFKVTIKGGIDTVTGNPQDFDLTAAVIPSVGEKNAGSVHANLNAFTTVIAAAIDAYASANPTATIDATVLSKQETDLVDNLGMGLPSGSKPSSDTSAANATKIAAANEALAEVIRRSTKQNVVAGKTATTADVENTIAMISADISDGQFDGYSSPKALIGSKKNLPLATATVADVAITTSATASTASTVIVEAVNNSGAVNVTDIYANKAVLAAAVSTSLATSTTKAIETVANTTAVAKAKKVNAPAPVQKIVIQKLVIAAPAATHVATQQTVTKSIAQNVASTVSKDAYAAAIAASAAAAAADVAAAKAASAAATAADIAAAAKASAAADAAAATAQTKAAKNSTVASNTSATLVSAGATPAEKSAAAKAATAAATAKATAVTQAAAAAATAKAAAKADMQAKAGKLAAAKAAAVLVAAQAKAQAAAAKAAAAKAAAAKAQAIADAQAAAQAAAAAKAAAKASGIAIAGNTITISGAALRVVAGVAAPATVTANNVVIDVPLTDYSKGSQNTTLASVSFAIKSTVAGDQRKIQGTLSPVTVVTMNGMPAAKITIPATATLTYNGTTRVGTGVSNAIKGGTFITSLANGGVHINANAFATQIGVPLTAGTFAYSVNITGVKVGMQNAGGTGLSSTLPATGVTGSLTVQ